MNFAPLNGYALNGAARASASATAFGAFAPINLGAAAGLASGAALAAGLLSGAAAAVAPTGWASGAALAAAALSPLSISSAIGMGVVTVPIAPRCYAEWTSPVLTATVRFQ